MKVTKVLIFDAHEAVSENLEYYTKAGLDEYDLLLYYNNQLVRKNKSVKPNIKSKRLPVIYPADADIKEVCKYELDVLENATISMLKANIKQSKDIYQSSIRKYNRYEKLLIENLKHDLGISDDTYIYTDSGSKCNLSPFNSCCYKLDDGGEFVCIFCGEPSEKK